MSLGSDSWLQLCEVSFSPTGDVAVIANETRLVILTAKCSTRNLNKFDISFSGSLDSEDPIRSVLCLPIVLQNPSSQV